MLKYVVFFILLSNTEMDAPPPKSPPFKRFQVPLILPCDVLRQTQCVTCALHVSVLRVRKHVRGPCMYCAVLVQVTHLLSTLHAGHDGKHDSCGLGKIAPSTPCLHGLRS